MYSQRNGTYTLKIRTILLVGIRITAQCVGLRQIILALQSFPVHPRRVFLNNGFIIESSNIIGIDHIAQKAESGIHIIMYRQKLIRFTHISHTYHIVETQHFRTSAKMHLTHTPDILTDHHVTADQLKAFAFRFETNLILQIMHFTHYRIDMIRIIFHRIWSQRRKKLII